jgi:peroxiredoxin Q/BCP
VCSRNLSPIFVEKTLLKEGDKAPAFRVTDDSGATVSLKDFHGKNVILYFYPKANTPG